MVNAQSLFFIFKYSIMADIPQNVPNSGGRRSAKRMSTHIDFTPMVDLGFLLITFFMLTTMISKPVVMPVVMPENDLLPREPLKASKVLTLLLGPANKVYWYEGLNHQYLDSTDYSAEGIRRVILNKMEKVNTQFGLESYTDSKTGTIRSGSYAYVLIKPMKTSNYQNLVDALDEMTICRVRYYTILDVSAEENAALAMN
jgi:biopolymer transport protein ExbD